MDELLGDDLDDELPPNVISCAIDDIALAALQQREPEAHCNACDAPIVGEPGGKGLFVWSRGDDEVQLEEPPLCLRCATAIGVSALRHWASEEEEEG